MEYDFSKWSHVIIDSENNITFAGNVALMDATRPEYIKEAMRRAKEGTLPNLLRVKSLSEILDIDSTRPLSDILA